jgi:acyl-CoA thioester hydrolase
LPEGAALVFQWPVRVYWEDTDAGGIVFYANYLKFFERARTEWLRSLGIEQGALRQSTGGMFVVSQASLRHLQPARLDDELCVTAELVKSGRSSLWIAQQARLKVCATILCEASIRIGWVDAHFKPARIAPCVLQRLNP